MINILLLPSRCRWVSFTLTILLFCFTLLGNVAVYAIPEQHFVSDDESTRGDFIISGYVEALPSLNSFDGVVLSFSGIGDVISDEEGFYEIEVPSGWSGDAIPHACDGDFYSFDPPQKSYSNVVNDMPDEDYTGESDTSFVISGTITDKYTGEPLANRQLSFNKAIGGSPWSIVVQTNELGQYNFTQRPCWNNTINPGVEGFYYLEPFTRDYSELSSDISDQDYTFINYEKPIPPGWDYTQTGKAHIIAIENTSFPNICGTPLELGDLLGVFYYDDSSKLKCGGYCRWQDESNIALIAQGDDNLTPTFKDGFANFEFMNWKTYSYSSGLDYPLTPDYKSGGFLVSNNKFNSGGLSIVLELDAFNRDMITLPQGWSGLSSHIKPNVQPLITNVMDPIADELIIIQNLEKVYYPAGGINTMLVWNHDKGYKIKVSQEVDLPIDGCQQPNTSINLSSTWNILPVMSACDVDPVELFDPILDKLMIVKEIAGTGVYWPEMGIQTLEVLESGRAYYVAVTQNTSVTYGECEEVKKVRRTGSRNTSNQSPWANPVQSGSSHTLAFKMEALENIESGDYIGAFSQDMCYGFVQLNDKPENLVMTIFGDDGFTETKDGFNDGERMYFRVFSSRNNEEINVQLEFNGNYPSSDGGFTDNGLSVVDNLKLNSSGLTSVEHRVNIYPNPSSGIVGFSLDGGGDYHLSLQNLNGQTLFDTHASGSTQLDFSEFSKGVYLVRIENDQHSFVKKLILK